jgi:hypothetical protein
MFHYRREIDGLRALAVVAVILFHAGFDRFSGGFVGVDIFFVISGYLITSIILKQKALGKFSLVDFYERRARRILPALFLIMLVSIPFAYLWLMPSYMKDFSKSLVAISAIASNILFLLESNYFDTASELKPLLHTWTLAVEAQFYFLFPLLLLIMWRFANKLTVVSLVVITVLSFALAQWGAYNRPEATFFLLPSRGWEIAIGVLIAFYLEQYPKLQIKSCFQEIGGLIGLTLILYAIFTYSKKIPFPSVYTLAPTLGTALILIFATPSTLVGRLLSTRVFVGVGLVSYSAYLWHYTIFVFVRVIFGKIKVIDYILLIALTFLIAYLTYRYVELPLKKKLNLFKNFFLTSLLFLCLFISFGLYGYFTNGIEKRLNANDLAFSKTIKRSSEVNCSLHINDCVVKASESPSVLLLGDSNAYHFSRSLKEVTTNNGFSYYQLTMGGCLPLANYFRLDVDNKFNKDCINFNSTIREAISKNTKKIEVIVVSAAWLMYLEGEDYFKVETSSSGQQMLSNVKLSLDGFTILSESERRENFDKYVHEVLLLLAAKSEKLIVVGPIPPLLVNFSNIKSFFDMRGVYTYEFNMNSFNFNKIIENNLNLKFFYIDIGKTLCAEKICLARDLHGSFYGDSMHFSDYGQRTFMKPLFRQIITKSSL